jgi:hypothetical protein
LNLAGRFNVGKRQHKSFAITPALKRRAKFIPTLRVEIKLHQYLFSVQRPALRAIRI